MGRFLFNEVFYRDYSVFKIPNNVTRVHEYVEFSSEMDIIIMTCKIEKIKNSRVSFNSLVRQEIKINGNTEVIVGSN